MPLRRSIVLALAFAPALAFAGCIENMGDLKEALGVTPAALPAPTFHAPTAVIDALLGSAAVGTPVRLLGEESVDPQGLPLAYAWEFGDGRRGEGAAVSHVYDAPGDYLVRLTVTNSVGLSDDDTLALKVAAIDRAPTVALRAPPSGTIGTPVAFEAVASDPEGAPLTFDWDLGDGATSHDAAPTHTYARPGLYAVGVRVTDAAGQRAHAAATVAVDGVWRAEGSFEPAGPEPAKLAFPVVGGAKRLDVALAYDAGLAGLNDLELVLLDGEGAEVARTSGGLGGAPARTLTIDAPDLVPGEWAVRVVKDAGVSVPWTLQVSLRLS